MGKKKTNPAQQVQQQAQQQFQTTLTPSPLENQFQGLSQNFMNNYNQGVQRNMSDYGNIMGQYNAFKNQAPLTAPRPAELGESYNLLREGAGGYRNFAETGGYSPEDIRDLRARGMAPVTAAYGNAMREVDRARSLGGAGGSPNYIAAVANMQRNLPQQLADAETGVNAQLANAIREGKQFGVSGIANTGQAMGGISSQEAARQLQAAESDRQMKLAAMGGEASLYGTSPGMASTFGNQALSSYGQLANLQQNRQAYGLGLLDTQLRGYNTQQQNSTPWWKTALGVAGSVIPFF